MFCFVLALLACGHPDPDPAEALVSRWEGDPQGVQAAVEAMPDGPEKIAVVEALAEAWPGRTEALCRSLPEGAARERCHTINTRPHLWQIDRAAPAQGRTGSGKVFPALVPTTADPWASLPPLDEEADHQHATALAWEAAMHGRARDAARACLLIGVGQWRDECFFQAAERSFEPGVRGDVGVAARLCLGAGVYASRCLGHLSTLVATQAPPSCASRGWEPVGSSIAQARRALQADDPALAERFSGDAWARAMTRAYGAAETPTGDPITQIEPAALPHLRAALAWRLLRMEGAEDRSLDEWVERLEGALAARAPCERGPVFTDAEWEQPDRWPRVRPAEEDIPRVSFLGSPRRALAADPRDDDAICVLEAAALDARAHPRLWSSAARHPNALVRWTLARLAPAESAEALAEDPDPRVRERALHP